jgi:NTP pyrophosphatase (non-canonical NTP hydrolase)
MTITIPSQVAIHSLAKEKGWYDGIDTVNLRNLPPDFIPAKLALIHSEISEALEAYRKDGIPNTCGIEEVVMGEGSMAEELADAVIRIFDLAGLLKIQIGSCILAKHRFNKSRPYRHGGKVV